MSISVSAVVLDESGDIAVREVVLPEAGPGEVRVRLAAAGVCHSDLSFVNGTLMSPRPIVLGHEGAGIVEAVGDGVDHVKPGDRVLLNWAPACRDCWYCNNGEPYLCPNSTKRATKPYAQLDDGTPVFQAISTGAFAEQTVVGAAGVVPLPDDLPLENAAVIGCAVLTGVGAVLNTARVQAGQSVAIVGLGGVGLSVVQGARIAGATTIIGVDASDAKESFAREAGATEFLIAGDDTVAKVQELTGGLGVDHAFEVVGTAGDDQARMVARAPRRQPDDRRRRRTRGAGLVLAARAVALHAHDPPVVLRILGPRPRRPADRGPDPQRGLRPVEPDLRRDRPRRCPRRVRADASGPGGPLADRLLTDLDGSLPPGQQVHEACAVDRAQPGRQVASGPGREVGRL